MTFLLTMFIGLAKRRDDVVICIETGVEVRTVVAAYNLQFIDTALSIMAAVTIVAYIMYTVSPDVVAKFHTDKLYLTTAFVVVGILRYLQMIFVEKKGRISHGNPPHGHLHADLRFRLARRVRPPDLHGPLSDRPLTRASGKGRPGIGTDGAKRGYPEPARETAEEKQESRSGT